MNLASFMFETREGHLDRARRVVSYLVKFKDATIIIITEEPNLASMPIPTYEREDSACGKVTELLPQDAPAPKGKHVETASYDDANMHYKVLIERSVTGFLHFLNKTL